MLICLFSISTWICRNEPDIQNRILDFLFQISLPPFHPFLPRNSPAILPIAQMSALILHFLSYPTSNPLTHIVRFSFEMYAESDTFLPGLLLSFWSKPLTAHISTTAKVTLLVFSPVSSLQPEWSFKNMRSSPAVHSPKLPSRPE